MTETPPPLSDQQLDEYEALAANVTLLGADIASPGVLTVLVGEVRRLHAAATVPGPAPTDWIDGHPQLEAIAAAVWEKCGRHAGGGSGLTADDPRNIAVAALAAALPAPAACSDPIECSHEAALGEAQQDVRRLGATVDEYGRGASALAAKLKRIRDLHREACILARGEVKPTAFTCGMCDLLDAPAAPLLPDAASGPGRADGKTQQDEPEALPLLFWDEPAGVVHEDGRITAWLSRAVNLAQAEPAGQLILQPDAAARLRRALTTALNEADDAREADERAAANCRDAEGCHRVVPCVPGCAARWQPAAVSQPDGEA
ncbi:hypothetical protein [Streptomyces sp. NPDC059759]|uniref:hypothetical protein n=1 Tax=Streptomyces sp. NPDC059759 TaxID=3346936 RepID=UPI00364FA1E3